MVAEYKGNVAGYINVYPDSQSGAFADRGYPEIIDFCVLGKYVKKTEEVKECEPPLEYEPLIKNFDMFLSISNKVSKF